MKNTETPNINETAMVDIHGLLFSDGNGVGRLPDGKVIFVDQASPGDRLKVSITKNKKSFSLGQILEIEQASSHRREPKCPSFGICGGCSLQHVDYETQVFEKNKVLKRYVENNKEIELKDFVPADNEWNYRSRLEVHVKDKSWGFFKKKSKELTFPKSCFIASEEVNDQLKNPPSRKGHYHVDAQGFENRSRSKKGVFQQVNEAMNAQLIDQIIYTFDHHLSEAKFIIDFYAGSGNFSIPLALRYPEKNFLAVELSETLVKKGLSDSKSLQNLDWVQVNVDEFDGTVPKDCVAIINPPRTGLSEDFIKIILKSNFKSLIYVSCNPMTLFRDLERLQESYKCSSLKGFDMFPQTMHFETLCLIHRK